MTKTKKKIRAHNPEHETILQSVVDGTLVLHNDHTKEEIASARCVSGCSALHWAAGCDHKETAAFLLTFMPADLRCTARSTKGRTPLHYAARNGCLSVAKLLLGCCDPNPRAKQGVTPFQLAVFQNQLEMARWFVEECNVDPFQTNDFGCGAVHWLAICPHKQGNGSPLSNLIPMAGWLTSLGLDWTLTQKQGHSAFHKAAWLGHTRLLEYLHEEHHIYDETTDHAGNYAADLADMAGNTEAAHYLRRQCSRDRAKSCALLGLPVDSSFGDIRQAYLKAARQTHPDHQEPTKTGAVDVNAFCAVTAAYRHLTIHHGHGQQRNSNHTIPLLLLPPGGGGDTKSVANNDDCFTARLRAVLVEYGDDGVELSNLKKKWYQVWRTPFPDHNRGSLRQHLESLSCVRLEQDERKCWRVHSTERIET